ncbi:hypothetical protein OE165_28625, partial [Escherichia coli]|uniref:hypothetical protein n=1 Tax=Escherichia coli TaxID=562 RepID=UPI0021F2587C
IIDTTVFHSVKSTVKDAVFQGKAENHGKTIYRYSYNNKNNCPACKSKHDQQGIYVYVKKDDIVMRGQSENCMRGDKDA